MPTISLELEAKSISGLFGSSIGAYGFLPDNPLVAEIPVTAVALPHHMRYLDQLGLPYKVNGKPFNQPTW
jgi:hypothetical protein